MSNVRAKQGGLALFPTPVGFCGIAWDAAGVITGVQLPEATEAQTVARLRRRRPGVPEAIPPPSVQDVIARIGRLLQGESVTFADVPLALDTVPEFHRRVYEAALAIPPGRTTTYGEIASRLGDRSVARAVGQALGANPFPIVVPCHRVLAAGGQHGGFSATGGVHTKVRLLALEGATVNALLPLFADE